LLIGIGLSGLLGTALLLLLGIAAHKGVVQHSRAGQRPAAGL
jgi:hypothetical protein